MRLLFGSGLVDLISNRWPIMKAHKHISKQLKVTRVRLYSRIRIFLLCLWKSDYNVLINDVTPSKISFGYPEVINIDYVLNLFRPILIGTQTVITITYHKSGFHNYPYFLRYKIYVDDTKDYNLEYYIHDSEKSKNYFKLSQIYKKCNYEHIIFHGNSNYDYSHGYANWVLDDNYILGFIKPEEIKLPEPLCKTCIYYNTSSYIKCAVNPMIRTDSCFDCRDFASDNEKELKQMQY